MSALSEVASFCFWLFVQLEGVLAVVFAACLLLGLFPVGPLKTLTNGDVLGYLHAHRQAIFRLFKRVKEKKDDRKKVISVEEFKRRVDAGERLTLIDHLVVDLKEFSARHPGGDFLNHFVGRDATPWFLISHSKSSLPMKMALALSVGVIECACFEERDGADGDEPTPCPVSPLLGEEDNEYLRLHEELRSSGQFANRLSWLLQDLGEVYLPLFLGLFLHHSGYNSVMALALITVAAIRQGFFFHDVGHHTVFRSAYTARHYLRYVSLLIWGLDFHVTLAIHAVHHGFVNVVGLDTALEMGPIKTHASMLLSASENMALVEQSDSGLADTAFSSEPVLPQDRSGAHLGPFQNVLFYGVLVWLVWPYYVVAGAMRAAAQQEWALLALMLVRAFLQVYLSECRPLLQAAVLGFVVFAVTGSLNHFHMPMRTKEEVFGVENKRPVSFVELQSEPVQNTDSSTFMDWFIGHFTLHIEHHLFPHLPRQRYNAIQQRVERMVRQRGGSYSVCGQMDAARRFNRKLADPF